jgi:mannosyltransferase OCH1-like enzyme
MRTTYVVILVTILLIGIVILVKKNLYDVPHFIPRTKTNTPTEINGVPLVIYQSWSDRSLPKGMRENVFNILKNNPEFDYFLYSDDECRAFIEQFYDPEVVWAFDSLIPGAYKSDLWRYCVLYKMGGVYMDIKCVPRIPLVKLMEKQPIVFVKDYINKGLKECIWNGFMIAPPGVEFFMECINEIVENCKNKDYRRNTLDITGPCLLGRVVKIYAPTEFTKYNALVLSGDHIYYNSDIAFDVKYPTYREEQKKFQKTAYYSDLYHRREVFA